MCGVRRGGYRRIVARRETIEGIEEQDSERVKGEGRGEGGGGGGVEWLGLACRVSALRIRLTPLLCCPDHAPQFALPLLMCFPVPLFQLLSFSRRDPDPSGSPAGSWRNGLLFALS